MKKSNPVPEKIKKLVREACKRHAWNLQVTEYQIDVHYMTEDKEDDDGITQADMTTDRRYLKATLRIYPHLLETAKKKGISVIDDVVAHEISHIATSHLYELATSIYKDEGEMKDAWESLTERISRLSLALDKLKK